MNPTTHPLSFSPKSDDADFEYASILFIVVFGGRVPFRVDAEGRGGKR